MIQKNDKLNFLFRKNKGKELMSLLLKELDSFLFKNSSDILSLEESEEVIQSVKSTNYNELLNFKIIGLPFNDKTILKCVVDLIAKADLKSVYVSSGYSEYCGLILISSINSLNTGFEFTAEHTGLIVLYSFDLQNKLILDFYREQGNELIDIEVYGQCWANVSSVCNKLV